MVITLIFLTILIILSIRMIFINDKWFQPAGDCGCGSWRQQHKGGAQTGHLAQVICQGSDGAEDDIPILVSFVWFSIKD